MLRRTLFCVSALLLASIGVATPARGDDSADEADLHFQLGAEAYQRGEYRAALQHFLSSNRLVPNRNVVYNVARTYDKLQRYPEAFRYYVHALEAESDPGARARIAAAIAQISRHVAVLEITSNPPGATVYIDRRDLGPRGNAPRNLGLAPGQYSVIAELPGHYPVEFRTERIAAGERQSIALELRPILGTVRVDGASGAAVTVDDAEAPACYVPCRLDLPPGRHTLHFSRPDAEPASAIVEVTARQVTAAVARLQPLTGTIVVSTDEPGALLEVDGRPLGFTPTIGTLPVGEHRVRVSLRGFRSVERAVAISAGTEARLDVLLTQAEEVTAASRVTESVDVAPSSVTILPERELRALAYPTIAEALRGVRGAYVWDDRSYMTVGFRGLGRLGSYGNRVLVLVDGHPLNDNWIGSSYVGYDARSDLEDIERIEVVRGPGSVVYGTNAFSGVLNLVTRSRNVPPGGELSVSAVGDGVGRARVRSDARFDNGGVWASASGARGEGRDFFFPEFVADTTPGVAGHARGVDGFQSGTLQGRLWWRAISAQWYAHSHGKRLPTGEYDTLLGDDRTRQRDTRASLELRADPVIGKQLRLMSRAHWNHYRFRGDFARLDDDGGVELDTFRGSWFGLEQRVELRPADALRVTFGGELQIHYQVEQRARDNSGYFLDDSGEDERPFQVAAGYASLDGDLSKKIRLSAGARLDSYSTFGSSVNPRLALITRPYSAGTLKLMTGKAFRAPSIYELYYNDDGFTQVANPDLEPESIYSTELEHSHRFSTTVSGTASVYANYSTDLIVAQGSGDEADPLRYENSGSPLLNVGAEVELRRDFRQGWMIAASYSLQHGRYLAGAGVSDLISARRSAEHRNVANSPEHLAALKGAVPIVARHVTLASRLSFEGPRFDRFESATGERQGRSDAVAVWDFVFSGTEKRWGLDWAVGVYNAFDWRYSSPVSAEFRQRSIAQSGRTLLASAKIRF